MVEWRTRIVLEPRRGFKAGITAGEAREFGGFVAFDEVELRFGALEAQGQLAPIGQQGELVEGAVEGCAETLDFAGGGIEAVETALRHRGICLPASRRRPALKNAASGCRGAQRRLDSMAWLWVIWRARRRRRERERFRSRLDFRCDGGRAR